MKKSFYVIYSNEKYLINKKIEEISNSFFKEEPKNIIQYDMYESNIDDVLTDLITTSLFEYKKIIICKNSLFFTTSKDMEFESKLFFKILDKKNDNIIIFIVNSNKLDERKKIVKEMRKKGEALFLDILNRDQLKNIIIEEFKKDKYYIDDYTANYFINHSGNNIDILIQEINKLKIYKIDDKNINEEDINLICSKKLNDNIFDLVNALVNREQEKAMELYDDLLIINEDPIKLISVVAAQFRLTFQVKNLIKTGMKDLEVAEELEVHPYRVKLAKEIKIDENVLLEYLYELANLDFKIKIGELDKNIAFEMFLLDI